MKILSIVGARPQFVKAAVISRLISQDEQMEEVMIHTGQHFDPAMSQIFFDSLQIPEPKYHLNIHSLQHGAMTGRMMEKIEEVMLIEKPDMVLIYGDTNSTLAGALTAKKLQLNLAHIEAGLRSRNMAMPEEVNRILSDRISDLLFAPSDQAMENLKQEGFDHFEAKVLRTGDIMLDAAMYYDGLGQKEALDIDLPAEFILCTMHRAENTDDPERLRMIVEALNEVHSDIPILMPLHPRTRQKLEENGLELNIKLIPPCSYLEMIQLIKASKLVMTDSGGLQKEAYFFERPCVTLREETEWVELIDGGFNSLCKPDSASLKSTVEEMLSRPLDYSNSLYGDGKTGRFILEKIKESLA